MKIMPIGSSRIHQPVGLLPDHEISFLRCGYFSSSSQALDILKILVGEIELTPEYSRWFFRREDNTPKNPFDVRLWNPEEFSEAIADLKQRWDQCSACIIEICTPRSFILDGISVQGNPNADRNVSYAEVWKDGYYVSYEPEMAVEKLDESESQISKNISDICRILRDNKRSGLFLGHLVDPNNPNPFRSRHNAILESAFKKSSFGRVKYFDCSPFVEKHGFRILADGTLDIHHLPWESLEALATSFKAVFQELAN